MVMEGIEFEERMVMNGHREEVEKSFLNIRERRNRKRQ
jgi:hypothetical protein